MIARAAFLALLSALTVGPANARAVVTPTACWFDTSGFLVPADCLAVSVPIDRKHPGKRLVFGVARIGDAQAKPLLFFPGGPGIPAMRGRFLSDWARDPALAEQLYGSRRWLIVEQRGAGYGMPLLGCGDLPLSDAAAPDDATVRALIDCGRAWGKAGIDLRQYRNDEVADDAADLLAALKIARVDVLGVSYGGSYALTFLRRHPDLVRSATLDSGVTPESNTDEETPAAVVTGLRRVIGEARMAALDAKAAERPPAAREAVARALFDAMYSARAISGLPALVDAYVRGDFATLEVPPEPSSYAQAQTLSVLCSDEIRYENIERMNAAVAGSATGGALAASIARFWAICRGWPVGSARATASQPVKSARPVLFLAGELDPCCGPRYGIEAVRHLPNGTALGFPGVTHVVLAQSACARDVFVAFLAEPRRRPADSCLQNATRSPPLSAR